jgi:hypothetical protein
VTFEFLLLSKIIENYRKLRQKLSLSIKNICYRTIVTNLVPHSRVELGQLLPDVVGKGLDQVGMRGPPVNHAPPHFGWRTPLGVVLVYGGHAGARGGTTVLWVLTEGHGILHTITKKIYMQFFKILNINFNLYNDDFEKKKNLKAKWGYLVLKKTRLKNLSVI